MLVSEILDSDVQPPVMIEDNRGAISCATNAIIISERTKHIDVRWHFVKRRGLEASQGSLHNGGPRHSRHDHQAPPPRDPREARSVGWLCAGDLSSTLRTQRRHTDSSEPGVSSRGSILEYTL